MRKKKYPSDISREQFEQLRGLLESASEENQTAQVELYEVFCAVLYLLKSGCQWPMLPGKFCKVANGPFLLPNGANPTRTLLAYWSGL